MQSEIIKMFLQLRAKNFTSTSSSETIDKIPSSCQYIPHCLIRPLLCCRDLGSHRPDRGPKSHGRSACSLHVLFSFISSSYFGDLMAAIDWQLWGNSTHVGQCSVLRKHSVWIEVLHSKVCPWQPVLPEGPHSQKPNRSNQLPYLLSKRIGNQ